MNIQENIKLAEYTSIKIGGNAKYFVEIKKHEELEELQEFIYKHNLDFFILGEGTNILINDEGFDGVVIRLVDKSYQLNEETQSINVSAGFIWDDLVKICIENSIEGFENMSGIPGTVGGAVRGNAGAYQTEIKDLLKSVTIYENNNIYTINNNECRFGYRDSIFKHAKSQSIILSAEFDCSKKTTHIDRLKTKRQEIISKREQKQPNEYPNAGSFFKNPIIPNKLLPNNITSPIYGEILLYREMYKDLPTWKMDEYFTKVSSAWLIENSGLKGYRYNDAGVSDKHSLFIVNYGNATSSDVVAVMKYVQEGVKETFWINLEPEVQLIGFD